MSVLAYGVAFLATLPAVLQAIYSSADTAIAPYLTQAWLRAPAGSVMLMGHAPFYLGYWILRFLHLFGGYRVSWELAPWVLATLASVVAGLTVARAAGRMAGFLVGAALICTGRSLLALQFAWSVHGLAYVNVVLLGAFAVWLASDPARRRPISVAAVALVLALMTATGIATDKIVLLAGLVPFAITGTLATWRAEPRSARRMACIVLGLVGGSIVGSVLIQSVMHDEGIRTTPFPVGLAPLGEVPAHLRLLTQSVFSLLNGDIHQPDASPTGPLGYLCAVAVLYLLIMAAIEAPRCLNIIRSLSGCRESGATVALDARSAQATYWGISAGVLAVAYLVTTVGVDIFTERYLVTFAYAVLVLGVVRGVTLSGVWRLLTAGAVTVLILTGTVALVRHDLQRSEPTAPTVGMANAVKRLAHSEHAPVVYAGYWDAYPLGWLVPDAVPVYPVTPCGATLCAWTTNQAVGSGITTWYAERHGIRSLLILDGKLDSSVGLPKAPPRSFGTPAARFSLDRGRLHAYLYDYDIAARFGA